MSKFDTCIYAEYFGDYGMNFCNHPSRGNDKSIYESDCRKCKFHITHKDSTRTCPFCGRKVYLNKYCGEFHITCKKCNVDMKDTEIEKLLERWNNRV